MGVIVIFDPTAWKAQFPPFAYLTDDQARGYFAQATLFLRNDGGGPIRDAAQQIAILNLVTAHVAKLFAPLADGQPASTIVGRISSASEGSVSVSAEMSANGSEGKDWFLQTPYGAAAWQALAPFRTMRYVPAPQYTSGVGFPLAGSGWYRGWPF